MKLYLDTKAKQVTVSKDPEPKNDQNGNQRSDKGTGPLMWSTQVFVLDETDGEVIAITMAGEKPGVMVGQFIEVEQSEPIPWATNGRDGVAFRAISLTWVRERLWLPTFPASRSRPVTATPLARGRCWLPILPAHPSHPAQP